MNNFKFPTEKDLNKIRNWKITNEEDKISCLSILELFEFISSLWVHNINTTTTVDTFENGISYTFLTEGIQSNIIIIEELKKNEKVWENAWKLSTSGGQHRFLIQKG